MFPSHRASPTATFDDDREQGATLAKCNIEHWASLVVVAIDLATTLLSIQVLQEPTSCCGIKNVLGGTFWMIIIGITAIYTLLLLVELYMILVKKMIFLTIANPLLGYLLAGWMLYSADWIEALATFALTTFGFFLDAWTLWKAWKERRGIFFTMQGLSLFIGAVVIYSFVGAFSEGGVCLVESPENGHWIFGFGENLCHICVGNGLPANNTVDPCYDGESSQILSGEYCGDDYNKFCFQEF